MAAYNDWAYGQAVPLAPLPRSRDAFEAAFGSLYPLAPSPINTPPDGSLRPEPRRFQYPVGWNMPVGTPGNEGLKLVPFAYLRTMAEMYSVVRACVELRKNEILGIDWDIGPTDEAAKAARGDDAAMADLMDRRAEAMTFFEHPDRNYPSFHAWLSSILEDLFVTDAIALYLHPPREQGKGVLGSNLAALEVLDGTTVRPLLDVNGAKPEPPNPAYQQYLWGVPRSEQMDVIREYDLDAFDMTGSEVAAYRGDQLLYLRYTARNWTPYGFSPVEQAILPAITGLRRQQYWQQYYSEGSIPGMIVEADPDHSNPTQVAQQQAALNALAGDQAYKHKIIVVPHGTVPHEIKQAGLADAFDDTLYEQTLMAFSVQPMELGLSPGGKKSGLGGKGMGDASENIQDRKATRPAMMWLKKSIFDYVLHDVLAQPDLEWKWNGIDPVEDQSVIAQRHVVLVHSGIESVDEARIDLGREPWGEPATSDPQYFTPTGLVPLIAPEDPEAAQPVAAPGTASPGDAPGESGDVPPSASPPGGGTALHSAQEDAEQDVPDDGPAQKAEAMLRELDALRNYLRHGRDPERFVTKSLTKGIMEMVITDLPGGLGRAIDRARKAVAADTRRQQRDRARDSIAAAVAGELGKLAKGLAKGQMQQSAFVHQAADTMQSGYRGAYTAGAQESMPGYQLDDDDETRVTARAAEQRPFLERLAQDISVAEAGVSLAGRLNLYGASTSAPYEQGYVAGAVAKAAGNPVTFTWQTTSGEPCDLCGPRDGETFTADDLPGYPGDGGFGGPVCEGGPNCKCLLLESS